MNPDDFSTWLMNEMRNRKLTINQLAKMTGLNHVTIGYYVTASRSPTFASLEMILKALGKHIEIVDN